MRTVGLIGLLAVALSLGILPAGVRAGQISGTCCCEAKAPESQKCTCCSSQKPLDKGEHAVHSPNHFSPQACCHALPLNLDQTARYASSQHTSSISAALTVPAVAPVWANLDGLAVEAPPTGPPLTARTVLDRTSRLLI